MRCHDFDSGNVWRLVLALSIPTCLSQAVNVLYAIVDRMFIGNIPQVGDIALSGVGVAVPVTSLISSFAVLIGLSRLMLRVHWPLDVLTGLVIGFVFALAFTSLTDRIYDQKEKRIRWCRCFSLISGLAGTVLMILLSFGLADPTAFSDLMKVLALASGSYAGCLIETLYASFTVQREWRKSILTVVLAMLGAALIMAAKLIVPSTLYYLGALVRYALIGLWATGLWPLIAVRLGLMESDA